MSVALEPTYTLADLKNWRSCRPSDGVALAVIGHPIAHSLSPVMHNAALAALAQTKPGFSQWRYFKFDIAPEELATALPLFHRENFQGLNLTVPHKALVVPQLVSKDTFVQDAGAANTLKFTDAGWHGYNTDGIGLSSALREDLSVDLKGANVILLGAGGAARAAALECLLRQCASLWIGNRTQATAEALRDSLRASSLAAAIRIESFDPKAAPSSRLPAGAIVINATSLGLKTDDDTPLDLNKIPRPAQVFDMIYRPPQTALLRQATELRIPNANGLSMLIHQGAASLQLWTGEKPPVAAMQHAARNALNYSQ